MKFTIIIDSTKEEEIVATVHNKSQLIHDIELLIENANSDLIGFNNNQMIKLNINEIQYFIVDDNRIKVFVKDQEFYIKQRLYQIETKILSNFVKINRSCIINLKYVKSFDTSFSGTIKVIMKNGYIDYVSRRQIKALKERMGV